MTDTSSGPSERIPVAVDVVRADVELVADALFAVGASAVAEHVGSDGLVTLTADLDARSMGSLSGVLTPGSVDSDRGSGASYAIRAIEPEPAWNTRWRDHARTHVCGRVVIRPEWIDAETCDVQRPDGAVEVVVEPGGAFGVGTHATTRICAEAVGRLVRGRESVLDVGSGTGVLGVAAALLGASRVVALDIDPEARRVTQAVAHRNGVGDRVRVSTAAVDELTDSFDLVFANLLIPVMEEIGATLVERVAPGGRLVVGGILADHLDRADRALVGLRRVAAQELDGWWACEYVRVRL